MTLKQFITSKFAALIAATLFVSLQQTAICEDYFAFTEPFQEIEVAASDSAAIQNVHVKLGDKVRKNDLLVTLDISVLNASRNMVKAKSEATATVRSLQIEHQLKKTRYEKLRELVKNGAGSPEEVSRAKADEQIALEKVNVAREEVRINELELKRIDAEIERRRVRTPINGVVMHLERKIGESVSPNNPLLAIIFQLDKIRTTFYVATADATKLQLNQELPIYLVDQKISEIGIVEYVSPDTKADSGRVRVDIIIDNKKGTVRSGLSARLSIQ